MIIDASVGVKWLVPEDDADKARLLLLEGPLFVPRLFVSEIANALWKKSRNGEIDLAEIEPLASLNDVVVQLDDAEFADRAIEIADDLNHPVYDCLYLAAAEALDLQLVTADTKFVSRLKGTAYSGRVVSLADASSSA